MAIVNDADVLHVLFTVLIVERLIVAIFIDDVNSVGGFGGVGSATYRTLLLFHFVLILGFCFDDALIFLSIFMANFCNSQPCENSYT